MSTNLWKKNSSKKNIERKKKVGRRIKAIEKSDRNE